MTPIEPDESSERLCYYVLAIIAGGSKDYEYGKKELPDTLGFQVDPRVRIFFVLGLLAAIPLFPIAMIVTLPGNSAPYDFLNFIWPPAVAAKKRKDAEKPKK